MKKSPDFEWARLVTVILLSALAGGAVSVSVGGALAQEPLAQAAERRANEVAANGPFPGDVTLYAKEVACREALRRPGYYPSLNGAEIADSERSGLFPCATFTGSHDGPNQVFALRGADDYRGISYLNTRKPGEIYIVGGEYPTPDDRIPAGPFVAKADATTGKEIWRTYLDNPNVSGRWIGNANLNILPDGNIAFAWSHLIALIDGDSGEILKLNTLPPGEAPVADVNFKHLTIAPDGTLILKDQTRPVGCTLQGTMAIIACAMKGMKMPNSVLVAVDPKTLEVLDSLPLPEPAASPHIVTMFEDKIAIYMGMAESARRYFWDPDTRKLTADDDWVVYPLRKGQTAMTAPTVVGDWIAIQTNGLFSDKSASSVVVVDSRDAKRIETIFPFGELQPGQWSFAPPKNGADPENNMIYSADMGMRKVAGIRIDPAAGKLSLAFVLDDTTTTFQPVIGPKDKRVLLLTNMKLTVPDEQIRQAVFTAGYTEQMTWRDAATGELLAESDFFEPLTINSLTTPGYGGRVYFPTAVGKGFYVLQPMPKSAAAGQ